MLDLEQLAETDLKLKDAIDENVESCMCSVEVEKWILQMLIIRKGIMFDMQFNDEVSAQVKLDLLVSLLTAGTYKCNC